MSATLSIVREQLVYRRISIVVALITIAAFLVTLMAIGRAQEEDLLEVAGFACFVVGMALGFHGWKVDTQERRVLLLCILPVTRGAVVGARMIVTALLQIAIAIPASAAMLIGQELSTAPERLAVVLSANLWSLAVIFSCYFFEEVNVALSSRRVLLWIVNIVPVVVALWFVAWTVNDDPAFFRMPMSLLVAAGVCATFASATIVLFAYRRTFEIGVSPLHGFPVRWTGK